MRNLIIAATAITLSGCAGSPIGPISVPSAVVTTAEAVCNASPTCAGILAGAAVACGFAPTAESLLSFLGADPPASVQDGITWICGQIARKGARRGSVAMVSTVNGRRVVLTGTFVR